VTVETAMKNINGITPDLVLQLGHLSIDQNALAGCGNLADTKALNASKQHKPQEINRFRLRSEPNTN
jgi:hypothetical protein